MVSVGSSVLDSVFSAGIDVVEGAKFDVSCLVIEVGDCEFEFEDLLNDIGTSIICVFVEGVSGKFEKLVLSSEDSSCTSILISRWI